MNQQFLKNGKRRQRGIALFLAVMLALALPAVALAHPLGNFTINHYAGLNVGRDTVTIDYVLDMAEIPAFQELSALGTSSGGQPDAAQVAAYHPAKCESIRSQLDLRLDGQPVAITLDSSSIDFPTGAGGLLTLRLTCEFRGALSLSGAHANLDFKDNSFADRLGWREIVVTANGVSLQGNFVTSSVSQKLTAYPNDMLSNPLDERAVSIAVSASPVSVSSMQPAAAAIGQADANRNDAFTQLITMQDVNPATLLFALLVSFVWGALHAMSPGHGKTMVAAYLVGSRGTARHALVLGLTVTLTHTAGVFALGLITLFASNYILPEQLYPWLSLISGVLVLGIGLTLLITRYRSLRSGRRLIPVELTEATHVHADHDHTHHHHDHDHDHGHALTDHDHDHDHGHTHSPLDDNGRITMRSLLALGISGGLIPCPTALVVLLSAVALGRIGLGLTLIVAFSAGLAIVLMGIGLLLVHGRRLLDRLPLENRLIRLLPLTGASLVILTGVVMTLQAIASAGRLSL